MGRGYFAQQSLLFTILKKKTLPHLDRVFHKSLISHPPAYFFTYSNTIFKILLIGSAAPQSNWSPTVNAVR
jgi:hypothetical protein